MDVFLSGAWRSPTIAEAFVGGQWRRLTYAEIYKDGAWKACARFIEPLAVSIVPSSAFGRVFGSSPWYATVVSNPVTATPSGGLGPYTYAWSVDDPDVTIAIPTQATTAFSALLPGDANKFAIGTVIVTDSLGTTAAAAVSITLLHPSGL